MEEAKEGEVVAEVIPNDDAVSVVMALGGLLTQFSESQKEVAKLQSDASIAREKEITERIKARIALDDRENSLQYGNDRIFQVGILAVFMLGILFAVIHADSDTLTKIFSYFGAFIAGLGIGRTSGNKTKQKTDDE